MSIKLATEAIYSEQFDMSAIVKRLSDDTGGINLVRAYISVSIAAGLTEPLSDADVDHALEKLRASEQHLSKPDFETILKMHKELAERNWSRRCAAILYGKLAFKNDEYSYAGMIYSSENAKQGPCSPDERKDTRTHHEKIAEAERKLEEHLAKTAEPDFQKHTTEQHIKEELDRLNHELELLEDPEMIYSSGLMSLDGGGVPQDHIEAASWFRIAAEQGHANAQHALALMYENGQGVSQDYSEAAKLYRMAAEQGHAGSQNNLGILCENGNGVTQDRADAIKWYQKAAENGDVNGLSNLNRLEARIDLDKYQNIVFAFSDLMAAHAPLIGDCSTLPYPKKTILYAIKWVSDDYETKRELTTNQTLRESYDKLIPTLNYLLTLLANNWHEIDPEDKDAIAKLGNSDSFPDWALPLKLKYINEEQASNEAYEATFQVLKDKVERERKHGKPDDAWRK